MDRRHRTNHYGCKLGEGKEQQRNFSTDLFCEQRRKEGGRNTGATFTIDQGHKNVPTSVFVPVVQSSATGRSLARGGDLRNLTLAFSKRSATNSSVLQWSAMVSLQGQRRAFFMLLVRTDPDSRFGGSPQRRRRQPQAVHYREYGREFRNAVLGITVL